MKLFLKNSILFYSFGVSIITPLKADLALKKDFDFQNTSNISDTMAAHTVAQVAKVERKITEQYNQKTKQPQTIKTGAEPSTTPSLKEVIFHYFSDLKSVDILEWATNNDANISKSVIKIIESKLSQDTPPKNNAVKETPPATEKAEELESVKTECISDEDEESVVTEVEEEEEVPQDVEDTTPETETPSPQRLCSDKGVSEWIKCTQQLFDPNHVKAIDKIALPTWQQSVIEALSHLEATIFFNKRTSKTTDKPGPDTPINLTSEERNAIKTQVNRWLSSPQFKKIRPLYFSARAKLFQEVASNEQDKTLLQTFNLLHETQNTLYKKLTKASKTKSQTHGLFTISDLGKFKFYTKKRQKIESTIKELEKLYTDLEDSARELESVEGLPNIYANISSDLKKRYEEQKSSLKALQETYLEKAKAYWQKLSDEQKKKHPSATNSELLTPLLHNTVHQ